MANIANPGAQNIPEKGINCLSLEVHMWSGGKRLRKQQLIARNPAFANLPPESLATLGSIKICNPKDLAPFRSLKRKAEKLMSTNGLPILGAFGFPDEKYDGVYKELELIKIAYDDAAASLQQRYDSAITLWRAEPENATWEHLIEDIPTAEQVAGKLSFDFHPARIGAPSGADTTPANTHYRKKMTGLKGELFEDGAREAEILITKYLTGANGAGVVERREKITWKTLRPLKRISEKFTSFAFLDPSIEPLADMIDHVLELLPPEGPIEGMHLVHIWTLARTLADPEKAAEVARMAFTKGDPANAFEQLVVQPKLQPVEDDAATPVQATQQESAAEPAEDASVSPVFAESAGEPTQAAKAETDGDVLNKGKANGVSGLEFDHKEESPVIHQEVEQPTFVGLF